MFLKKDSGGSLVRASANQSLIVFESKLRSVTHDSEDFENLNFRGVQAIVDITNETPGSSTHSIIIKIQGKDPATGKYYDLLTTGAITVVLFATATVYPGITASAGSAVSNALPRIWRVRVEHTADGASNMTYSIGCNLII